MKNRLGRLLKVLEWYPRSGAPDIDAIALQLGSTPATIRRDLRDLREAGAFDPGASNTSPEPRALTPEEPLQRELPLALPHVLPANDDSQISFEQALSADELLAMYVGARFLAAQGDHALGDRAHLVLQHIERLATPELVEKMAILDTRFRFGPRNTERRIRSAVAQAITERRTLEIMYRGERDKTERKRLVEPTAQFFIHDRWSFYAFDLELGETRQFRHERCSDAQVTEQPFRHRHDGELGGFVAQRRRSGSRH
ncbi:MAG: WYL domain-containing protein [Deltaproteobacteria bacterium]|nr:WYL domain-containing protein [Deltaproteobacteria bacterium]